MPQPLDMNCSATGRFSETEKGRQNNRKTIYKFKIKVVPEFDTPGALRIENRCHREFFLEYATLSIPTKSKTFTSTADHGYTPSRKRNPFGFSSPMLYVYFLILLSFCSLIMQTLTQQLVSPSQSYLPSEMPLGLRNFREYELK